MCADQIIETARETLAADDHKLYLSDRSRKGRYLQILYEPCGGRTHDIYAMFFDQPRNSRRVEDLLLVCKNNGNTV